MNLDSLRTAADLSATKPHGTRLKYMGGCTRDNRIRRMGTAHRRPCTIPTPAPAQAPLIQ